VRFAFKQLPGPEQTIRPRPIIDVVVGGLAIAPQACLLDSGATAIRLGEHVAELCGIDLAGAEQRTLGVGGGPVTARMAEVELLLADATDSYAWIAPVWFCDPWTPAFGLLGLTGFFDHFEVTIASYEERIELTPVSGASGER
jgi:hypothetical protein